MDLQKDRNMPGITFQAVSRARKQATIAELNRRGLGDLGNPILLFILHDRGVDGKVTAQKELSDALHVSPATVAVSLKSLERGGYVEKLPVESDQRRKAVRLTPKGEGAIHRCWQVFQDIDRTMFDGFSPEEVEQVCSFHMRMLRNLRGDLPPERMNCQC